MQGWLNKEKRTEARLADALEEIERLEARAEKAEAKLQAVMQWKVDNDRKIDENASLDLYMLLTE